MQDQEINGLLTKSGANIGHPFYCVWKHIDERIQSTGGIEPRKVGRAFLSLLNLEFIFYRFLERFEEEHGLAALPENQSLNYFASIGIDHSMVVVAQISVH